MNDDDLNAAAESLANDFQRIEEKLDKVLSTLGKVEGIAVKIAEQVKPLLDDLMKSPILKMLGVKTK